MSLGKAVALNFTMKWISERMVQKRENGGKNLLALMRTISPRHFTNGEWNSGGRCDFLKV